MKGLIFMCMLMILISCMHSAWKVGECRDYRKMVQANWLQDSIGLFYFKGHAYPAKWEMTDYQKYFKEDCLIGLPQKEIIKLVTD